VPRSWPRLVICDERRRHAVDLQRTSRLIYPFARRRGFTLVVLDLGRNGARHHSNRLIDVVPRSQSHHSAMARMGMMGCEGAKILHHRSAITP
jgi:hypothetical protein